jgi:two-component system, OmpR family, alkaline phosphatase synthesis response regulator PhoP
METNNGTFKKSFILVVEDEEDIVRLQTFHLEKEGYRVVSAGSGRQALEIAFAETPDLVILDIMLPEIDGLEVCRRLRANESTASVPVMILSARKEELDKVLGLELGADDYMIKPFSVRELVARVRAMLRRFDRKHPQSDQAGESEEVLNYEAISLYPQRHQVTVDGEQRTLTHKEFLLLQLLMSNPGKVITRELLLDRVWGYDVEIDTRTVDVHVRYLRKKIEKDPSNPRYIETVRGVGYRFSDV